MGPVAGNDDQPIPARFPARIGNAPRPRCQLSDFFRCNVENPEPGEAVVLIDDARVILVPYFLFLVISSGFGSKKSDLFAVGRPVEPLDGVFSFGQPQCFSSVHRKKVDLILAFAVRDKKASARPSGLHRGEFSDLAEDVSWRICFESISSR